MADINKTLKRAIDGKAPQHYSHKKGDFVVTSEVDPLPVQLTGSNVRDEDAVPVKILDTSFQEEVGKNITITPGSVYGVTKLCKGKTIGVGVRFNNQSKFRVDISARNFANTAVMPNETIIDNKNSAVLYASIKYELKHKNNYIAVYNHDTTDINLLSFNITHFL